MLLLAFCVLCAGATLGLVLALLHGRVKPPPLAAGLIHGTVGLSGLAILVAALGGPPRGVALGGASFGIFSVVMLVGTALAGLAILTLRARKKRLSVLLVGLHATLAMFGVVILAAYLSLPA